MATPLAIKKEMLRQASEAKTYKRTPEEKAADEMFTARRDFLKEYRMGLGVEEIWKAADKAYIPHRITASTGKKVLVSDDELGWRSAPIDLNRDDNWQEDSVPPNPYIKIQTALGIIVDQNPTAVLSAGAKKYEKNTILVKHLYETSWEIAHSKEAMLKPFVFNQAKYGIGIGRTFPLEITKTVRDLKKYNPEGKSIYKEVKQTYYDDIFRESMSPWTVWLDDATKIGNPFSCQDVVYYKDYDWHEFELQFGHLANFKKYCKPEMRVLTEENELRSFERGTDDNKQAKYQTRVWFWESFRLDLLFIKTDDGIVLVNEPLPQTPKNKKLSIYFAPWTLRDDVSPYGIGVYEAMRNDHKLHTKLRNMTMDQVVLSIYREFFYTGTDTLDGDGQMKTRPGRGRQVNDAKNIKWNEIPGPGEDAWKGLAYQESKIDDSSGISKSLEGQITGSTAFEISQARESALKRMKTPLENLTDALETDAYISISIIEDLYSVPKIRLLIDDKLIQPFEIDMYENQDGEPLQLGHDYEEEFREVPLNLSVGNDGEIMQSDSKQFIRMREDFFPWEGVVKIKGQSVIANSELLERVTINEMTTILVPLFQMAPEIAMKPATQIVKAYDKDPEEWLPDAWLNPPEAVATPETQLFVDPEQAEAEEEEVVEEAVPGLAAPSSMDALPSGNKNSAIASIASSMGDMMKK